MDARGFSRWLDRHHLSPKQAAEYLGVDRKTIDRFLSGDLEISQRTSTACRALNPMRLYRLTPIDLNHNDWRASSYKAPVIVRAQGFTLARWHAVKRFHVQARRRSSDEESPSNPWTNHERVSIERLRGEAIPRHLAEAGQPGVVDPPAP